MRSWSGLPPDGGPHLSSAVAEQAFQAVRLGVYVGRAASVPSLAATGAGDCRVAAIASAGTSMKSSQMLGAEAGDHHGPHLCDVSDQRELHQENRCGSAIHRGSGRWWS